jgi:hypothetical protein
MIEIHAFVAKMARLLGLSYPISVTICNGTSTPEGWNAFHQFWGDRHTITVAEHPDRGFMAVLCHEIAHAMVDEVVPGDSPHHSVNFQLACVEVVNAAAQLGLTLGSLYDPEIDVT